MTRNFGLSRQPDDPYRTPSVRPLWDQAVTMWQVMLDTAILVVEVACVLVGITGVVMLSVAFLS
jgi:hypothetical protein